jgi:hypothetical protein
MGEPWGSPMQKEKATAGGTAQHGGTPGSPMSPFLNTKRKRPLGDGRFRGMNWGRVGARSFGIGFRGPIPRVGDLRPPAHGTRAETRRAGLSRPFSLAEALRFAGEAGGTKGGGLGEPGGSPGREATCPRQRTSGGGLGEPGGSPGREATCPRQRTSGGGLGEPGGPPGREATCPRQRTSGGGLGEPGGSPSTHPNVD